MSRKIEEKDQKIHNPQAEFDKPTDVLKDPELSKTDKKKALENLEQDAARVLKRHRFLGPFLHCWQSSAGAELAKSHKTSRLNEVSTTASK
jgi:hypothetical protein